MSVLSSLGRYSLPWEGGWAFGEYTVQFPLYRNHEGEGESPALHRATEKVTAMVEASSQLARMLS